MRSSIRSSLWAVAAIIAGLALVAVSLSSCAGAQFPGAMVDGSEGRQTNSQQRCVQGELATYTGDLAGVLWAANAALIGKRYVEVIGAYRGTRVCLLPRVEPCGGVPAAGCSYNGTIWAAMASPTGEPVDWQAVLVHEAAHVIAWRLGIPSSNAHAEPIHVLAEPLVLLQLRRLQ